MHENEILWNIHAVHHCPARMDWLSGSRTHFAEVLFAPRPSLCRSICWASPRRQSTPASSGSEARRSSSIPTQAFHSVPWKNSSRLRASIIGITPRRSKPSIETMPRTFRYSICYSKPILIIRGAGPYDTGSSESRCRMGSWHSISIRLSCGLHRLCRLHRLYYLHERRRRRRMVGATGIEPATSSPQTRRATRLRHAPTGHQLEAVSRRDRCEGRIYTGHPARRVDQVTDNAQGLSRLRLNPEGQADNAPEFSTMPPRFRISNHC